ncbi:hypothetical protein [Enterovibrio norvegicus]|uniref:hypothetical protein n=1 Tax=Enterovibrio norvegicus TaxID=188144 RepID=UPI00031DABF9|nr:hypothetical protein [Enterovibrio norvegicus]
MKDIENREAEEREDSIIQGLLDEYEDTSNQYLGSSKDLLDASNKKLMPQEMLEIFKDRSKYYSAMRVIRPITPIKLVVVHISPTMARDILEFSRRGAINKENSNRRIKQRSVKQYAELMDKGRWCLNGEAIIFDADGELLDGHTRLAAAEKSSKGFITVMIWGITDTKAFANTNVGDNRSRSNVLEMAGVKVNAQVLSQVASLAKAFHSAHNPYAYRGTQGTAFRGDEILAYVKQHEELALSVNFTSKLAKKHKHQCQTSEAVYAFAHYLIKQNLKKSDIKEMSITPELYITNVMSGLGQTSTESIEYKVREYIQTTVGESSSYALLCRLSCIFKGWNMYMGIPVVRKRVAVTRVGKFYKDEDGAVVKAKAAGNIKEAFTIPCLPPGKTPVKIKKAAALQEIASASSSKRKMGKIS